MNSLFVIIPDRLSVLVEKGEITPRYYNPGEIFSEVHIVMTNDDRVSPEAVQKTVGAAKMYIYNLPAGRELFAKSLGWRPGLLNSWAEGAVRIAAKARPALVRCHGNFLNAYAALRIKKRLGVPYIVSLHTNPDTDMRGTETNVRDRIYNLARMSVEKASALGADMVMPVYEGILPYTSRLGVRNVQVAYNVLDGSNLHEKEDYSLHSPVRVISIGRQFREKNPENLIRAVAGMKDLTLTMVGDGEYHDHLRGVADETGAAGRVEFRRSVPNDELCASLRDYDIFATHSDYLGIPKAVMEPMLTGLPIVMNKCAAGTVAEFQGGHVALVDNTQQGYAEALGRLTGDGAFRKDMGRKAYEYSRSRWDPAGAEKRVVEIYRRVLCSGGDA